MGLYAHTLKPTQIATLGGLFVKLSACHRIIDRASAALTEAVAKVNRTNNLNKQQRRRIFKEGRMLQDSSLNALLYDFMTTEVYNLIEKPTDAKERELRDQILKLKHEVNHQILRFDNPFAILARDIENGDAANRVPEVFLNSFYGYRRSASGEVLRFFIRIYQRKHFNQSLVRFTNRYWRGQHQWNISGSGIYAKNNVLYLFGHARDMRGDSTGYRLLALQQLGATSMICGPLISMDERRPLAARVVLIPEAQHKLSTAQQRMKRKNRIEYMIRSRRMMALDDEYEDFIKEVGENVKHLFQTRGTQGLFHYISNLTTNVIHCSPEDDDELIIEELKYRKKAFEDKYDYRFDILNAMREYWTNKNTL